MNHLAGPSQIIAVILRYSNWLLYNKPSVIKVLISNIESIMKSKVVDFLEPKVIAGKTCLGGILIYINNGQTRVGVLLYNGSPSKFKDMGITLISL